MDDDSLDFVMCCLKLDPNERWSASQLLNHRLFDEEFKVNFQKDMQSWISDEATYN
jgi:serine/threonine protein kinase